MSNGAQTDSGKLVVAAPPGVMAEPAMQTYMEDLIDRKLDERLGGIETRINEALARLKTVEESQIADRTTLVVFSGEFDRLIAAFIIATGSVAMGFEASMYFTFWGLTALKKKTTYKGKTVFEKMMGMMLPSGPGSVGTSRLNMMGIGPAFFKSLMKKHNVETLPDLIATARELGVRMVACQMSMGIMGITKEELIDDIDYGGVTTYLGDSTDSKITLFV